VAHALALEDTIIVDDPDAEPVMHVIVMGQRHRRTPDLATTAYGVPFHSQFALTRPEQLTCREGPLCPECFTPFEIDKADLADRRQGDR
jgi:hypothetical protein